MNATVKHRKVDIETNAEENIHTVPASWYGVKMGLVFLSAMRYSFPFLFPTFLATIDCRLLH